MEIINRTINKMYFENTINCKKASCNLFLSYSKTKNIEFFRIILY